MFVIKASSTRGEGLSPSTGHRDQTEKAWQCKQSLNYDTYYFLLVVKTKNKKKQSKTLRYCFSTINWQTTLEITPLNSISQLWHYYVIFLDDYLWGRVILVAEIN